MLFPILLIGVTFLAGYHGFLVLRRGAYADRTYGYMLLGTMVLGIAAFVGLSDEDPSPGAELLGFVTIAVFVSLALMPALVRDVARRALARDRIGLARRLLGLRELLQPGLAARQEREFVETLYQVRTGRIDEALAALHERRRSIEEPLIRRAIDERIVLALIYARRWQEAVEHYEGTLEAIPGPLSAHLVVELVRAYGEVGQLEKAAELLEQLESSPMAGEPMLLFLLMRARMVFLAFVGRSDEVEQMVVSHGSLSSMPRAQRSYWIGVARYHAGDRDGAVEALSDALEAAGKDTRVREIAAEALSTVKGDSGQRTPPPQEIAELADRVAKRSAEAPDSDAPMPGENRSFFRVAPATALLLGLNVAVAVIAYVVSGSLEDLAFIVKAGANVKEYVRAGEWWRLHASTFLHIGPLHLLLNMYGLWILGKILEPMVGSLRLFVTTTLAGIAGAVASLLFLGGPLSAGASGGVFGLLGALIAELALKRGGYPTRWRRMLLGNLVFLVVLNVALGVMFPMIDQAAHLGGFAVGGLLSAALSQRSRVGKALGMRVLVAVLTAASVASLAYSGVSAALSLKTDWQRRALGGASIETPRSWIRDGDRLVYAAPRGFSLEVSVNARDVRRDAEELADERAPQLLGSYQGVTGVKQVEPTVPAPEGWVAREVRFVEHDSGRMLAIREALYLRLEGAYEITFIVQFPESATAEARAILPRVIASARVVRE